MWNVLILLLDHNTNWRKHMMEKHDLFDQSGFLSGQNLSLAQDKWPAHWQKLFAGLQWSL